MWKWMRRKKNRLILMTPPVVGLVLSYIIGVAIRAEYGQTNLVCVAVYVVSGALILVNVMLLHHADYVEYDTPCR